MVKCWQCKIEVLGGSLSHCHFVQRKPPHELAWDRTQVFAKTGRRLTAGVMAQPWGCSELCKGRKDMVASSSGLLKVYFSCRWSEKNCVKLRSECSAAGMNITQETLLASHLDFGHLIAIPGCANVI
jgi:hypothetical protein